MKILDRIPTKCIPDWKAVAELAAEHGAVLLPLDICAEGNAAHASLHRFGMGFYRARDATGAHVGWRVAPLSRKNKTKPSEELT